MKNNYNSYNNDYNGMIKKHPNNPWIDFNITQILPSCPPINSVSVGHISINR